jgi:hypothetical protein
MRLPAIHQSPAVFGHDQLEHPLDRADVHAGALLIGQRHPVGRRDVLVDQEPLHDGGETRDVTRQPAEQRGVSPGRRHGRGPRIELEPGLVVHLHWRSLCVSAASND